jgi:hypothetical protein
VIREATFDVTREYRYSLFRSWLDEPEYQLDARRRNERVLWVMLNPSTADEREDDRTIGRCVSFSRKCGYGSLMVCNLFALRAKNSGVLWTASEPVGPDNLATITREAINADLVVAAWGAHRQRRFRDQERTIVGVLRALKDLWSLKRTKNGRHPCHPLYLHGAQLPELWLKREPAQRVTLP